MQGPLGVVAVAIAPVVMISATAVLIGGVSAKHQSMGDRVRQLMTEYRREETTVGRKENNARQIDLFRRRLRHAMLAHLGLYFAVSCFIGMVMAIVSMPVTESAARLTMPLFVAGVLLLLGAVIMEVLELLLAGKTLSLETDQFSNSAQTTV
ncbi:MAG: DUF2721 domain-containing protein [Acidobacteriota bacterium]|nr:DUF2721 domain-containing protein [Acidobacteriota bacterium]